MSDPGKKVRSSTIGQGMVEFALISVAFFAIIFGIVEGGRLLFTYHEVNHAAREGVRFAAAQGYYSGNVMSAAEVEDYVQSVTTGLDWTRFDLTAEWPGDPNIEHCAETPNRNGCPVLVNVSYQFEPIVGMIFGDGAINLNSTTSMRIHY